MNQIKTPAELEIMRTGGKLLRTIRNKLLAEIRVGAIPLDIDNLAKKLIAESGGTPSFMTVKNYQWATCISANEGVVHGVPDRRPFAEGDVVGLDVGLLYKGFHTDTSWTKIVQSSKFKVQSYVEKFIKTGEIALERAIKQVRASNRIGHISQAIQETIAEAGYSVVRTLVGHGIGRLLHEAPQVPGILTKPLEKTPALEIGMTLAIEVIYNLGGPEITYANNDGWTLVTADSSLSGLFEQTVAITAAGPLILT